VRLKLAEWLSKEPEESFKVRPSNSCIRRHSAQT
jgi:hypothetical protein